VVEAEKGEGKAQVEASKGQGGQRRPNRPRLQLQQSTKGFFSSAHTNLSSPSSATQPSSQLFSAQPISSEAQGSNKFGPASPSSFKPTFGFEVQPVNSAIWPETSAIQAQ